MEENVRRIMDGGSDMMAPVISQQNYDSNVDYIINEYMERLGTRLNILETELKYAWRALDLLSQEYIKMWERLEKLESLLYEQQSVISQLLDFYASGGGGGGGVSAAGGRSGMGPGAAAMLEGRLGELEVIREILGNGTVEDGLEEGLDVSRGGDQTAVIQELDLDEMHVPNEAFYRSLNQAYREDLVSCDPNNCQGSQLGMIWEEREEIDNDNDKKLEINDIDDTVCMDTETQEIYSAMDYKDYRGNSPCVSEQDIAQLSRIDSIDHVAIEKLNELDRLSNKLHQDSVNIKQLQRKLLESPLSITGITNNDVETVVEQKQQQQQQQTNEQHDLDEQLQQIYTETDNWSFTSGVRDQDELLILSKSELPNSINNIPYSTRPSSRLSVSDSVIGTDNEVAEALAGGIRTPTSPRRRQIESVVSACSAPYTTVTGRLAYSAAVQHVEAAEAAAAVHNSKNPFYTDYTALVAASYEQVQCSTPSIFSIKSEKAPSPTLSVCSVRTRQDGYIGTSSQLDDVQQDVTINQSYSPPPPPAPRDAFLLTNNNNTLAPTNAGPSQVFLGDASQSSITPDHCPRTPHSPNKSPKTSPKRSKSHTSNIVAAKSDSGLSSMSGWSSLEKSPGSPKNNGALKNVLNYYTDVRHSICNRPISPIPPPTATMNARPFSESSVDSKLSESGLQQLQSNAILPGGHHLSAFTSVKSPCSMETSEGYGTFVPAPAPASDINVSPKRKSKHDKQQQQHQQQEVSDKSLIEFISRNDQPAIYSVAGSNRDSYTSVYTSNSADYISQTINYPDLIEPYENNEYMNAQQHAQYLNSLSSSSSTTQQQQQPPSNNMEMVQHTSSRRRSLSRSYSINKPPENLANHEGYKTAMYRTMFPTGNITDALSYYPTSSRYESAMVNLPQTDYNDPSAWLNCPPPPPPPEVQYQDSASTSSSMRSAETSDTGYTQSPFMDTRRHHPQQQQQQQQYQQNIPPQPIYENQQQIEQHKRAMWNQRQEIPYLELELRNRNVPEYIVQQQMHGHNKYYDPASGVIMTQSGYITIQGSETTNRDEQKTKKMKRGNTLKSAMSSVSHWLPDLHLTKRHRSYSLPGGIKREDVERTKSVHVKSNVGSRKKKRNPIVSTVSGILQRAKRKTSPNHYSHSLSDPEQSDNEWVINRTSSVVSEDDRSEDSYSIFSESQTESRDLFAKVPNKSRSKKVEAQQQHQYHQQQQQQQYQQQQQQYQQQQQQFQQQQQQQFQPPQAPPPPPQMFKEPEVQQLQVVFEPIAKTSPQIIEKQFPKSELEQENGFSGIEEEMSNKSNDSGNIFTTMGDNKRSSGSASEKSDETIITDNKMVVVVGSGGGGGSGVGVGGGSASMEFAVSRALGKYRQRQSSTVSDDQIFNDEQQGVTIEEIIEEPYITEESLEAKMDRLIEQKSTESQNGDLLNKSMGEENLICEGSPSANSLRAHMGRYLPKHQQSLEIPGHRDDDDCKSTHSWRSTSRVSSRRQSTEDSIDSEDEWYCYELRKLEEMERQTQLEVEMGKTLEEEPEPIEEEEPYEPAEEVKEKMSFVLRELRMKAKVVEGVLNENDNNLHVVQSAKRRGSNRSSFHLENAADLFAKVTHYPKNDSDDFDEDFIKRELDMFVRIDEDEQQRDELQKDVPKEKVKDDDERSSGDTSGPDSPRHSTDEYDETEMAINEEFARCHITKEQREADELKASIQEQNKSSSSSGEAKTEKEPTSSIPKIEVDSSTAKDEPPKEQGALGSKWKLLKTLKEKKAEEKSNQTKPTETAEKEKVSMIGMMQKFYEIHVKT